MTKKERKQLYLELLSQVDGQFKTGYDDKTKEANPALKISTIQNVRYGRSPNLLLLLYMISVNIPDFKIPEKFLNAANPDSL